MKKWQTKEELIELLCSLVDYPSITESDAEIAIVQYIHHLLSERTYFQQNPKQLALHPLDDGRQLLTALVKSKKPTKDTIVLVSHIDVVDVEDYGSFMNLAFHPKELTREFHKNIHNLPEDAQNDIRQGEWLFGRGTMDMKAGLTLQLNALEKAMDGNFDGNLLLLVVPDEEANSSGMLAAIPVLNKLKEEENLTYSACLNSEPMFRKHPGDENSYMYMGSIGKVLPGFYCYGKETHVGEPFGGVNANVMVSYLNQELELQESFIEKVGEETTPPPVSLMNRDLKEKYSVQTPISAISMYNVLFMKQSISDITEKLLSAAEKATKRIEHHYKQKAGLFSEKANIDYESEVKVRVMLYEDLYKEAVRRVGEQEVDRRQKLLINNRDEGDRDFSTLLVQDLALLCKDLAPMMILFYSPPFYPSVSSKENDMIQNVLGNAQSKLKERHQMDLELVEFFPGLSDLSFIGPMTSKQKTRLLQQNMPIDQKGYTLDTDALKAITMPILNIGPLGKDAHQWTERLELNYSYEIVPEILEEAIQDIFRHSRK
ncbi:M20/M25/M40 family metallo-hydrolase [Salinibacillus xinjiangensis]|uniref:M20/M25/M40 family metallo-hydrolase n=1 Tax=Salinibacillus xinjiangensis TaxID=1229268 RepID=A0A6G1X6G2_9BACI|nr:M20/M25/M40 family metallo-hydrolase [Salinibacillus xinjiangensis]MRG86495.1 M20/M25/M40 family metallo-hydrolase [Salinibacillus xinjiangensis]